MTLLQRNALASVPLTEATVQSFYDGSRSGTAEQCLRALCESHERLRAELQGAELLLAENQKLGDVVKQVHAEHADDLCWMDIDRIFAAAGLPVPDRKVGCKFSMVKNCVRFVGEMCQEGGGWKSYAELEAEIEQLKRSKAK